MLNQAGKFVLTPLHRDRAPVVEAGLKPDRAPVLETAPAGPAVVPSAATAPLMASPVVASLNAAPVQPAPDIIGHNAPAAMEIALQPDSAQVDMPTAATGTGPRPGDDPLVYLQWYIDKTGLDDVGVDMNVRPVWEGGGGTGYTGAGIRVGVFDGLIERGHPDLEANYDASLEVDGLYYAGTDSGHGVAVAGIIAAAKNGVGMTGIAYDAKLTSLPVIYSIGIGLDDLALALANAANFDIVNMSLGGQSPFDLYDLRFWFSLNAHYYADASELGRGGLGTLLIQSAGNNRTAFPLDANLSAFQNQRYSITVSAVDAWGMVSEYSSEGANVLVAATSNGSYFAPHIATTDRVGDLGYNKGDNPGWDPVEADYTTRFGGTSAAAPIISGITALILEANPDLGWRDVRDILAFTARHTGTAIDGTPSSWLEKYSWDINASGVVNGTGLHFNQNYGFGLVDALAAVRLAESWTRQRTSANEASRQATVTQDLVIPEVPNNPTPLIIAFDIDAGVTSQIVTLYLDMNHKMANELVVKLISPSGTQSLIFDHKGYGPSIYGTGGTVWTPWTFTSNHFVGEDATGTWQLVILDNRGAWPTNGVFKSATLTVYGDATSPDNDYIYTNEFGVLAGMDYGYTITDTSGIDTVNAAAVTAASVLDLRGAAPMLINGMAVTIAAGTIIENAWGGDGGDRLYGNSSANRLNGMRGNDTLTGGSGDDTLSGGSGNDYIIGGVGNDNLSGEDGRDTLSYGDATAGITIDLSRSDAQSTGGAGSDKVSGFENLEGSDLGDDLTGSDDDNIISARGGHDRVGGGNGHDRLSGGAGNDTLDGGNGDDTVTGGSGGDRLSGALGLDLLNYADSVTGVRVNLTSDPVSGLQYAAGGDAQGDIIDGFEHVTGGTGHDALTGDDGDNQLTGGQGNDTLSGGGGDDRVSGGDGDDMIGGRAGNDYVHGGAGNDTGFGGDGDDQLYGSDGHDNLSGELGNDTLSGGSGDDRLQGHDGDDRITGGGGADQLRGGHGNDVFVYTQSDVVATGDAGSGADLILDFFARAHPYQQYDRIDLLNIDAIDGGANNAFSYIGDAAFTAAGQLRVWFDGVNTRVQGNTIDDSEGHVELEILLAGNLTSLISAVDFLL